MTYKYPDGYIHAYRVLGNPPPIPGDRDGVNPADFNNTDLGPQTNKNSRKLLANVIGIVAAIGGALAGAFLNSDHASALEFQGEVKQPPILLDQLPSDAMSWQMGDGIGSQIVPNELPEWDTIDFLSKNQLKPDQFYFGTVSTTADNSPITITNPTGDEATFIPDPDALKANEPTYAYIPFNALDNHHGQSQSQLILYESDPDHPGQMMVAVYKGPINVQLDTSIQLTPTDITTAFDYIHQPTINISGPTDVLAITVDDKDPNHYQLMHIIGSGSPDGQYSPAMDRLSESLNHALSTPDTLTTILESNFPFTTPTGQVELHDIVVIPGANGKQVVAFVPSGHDLTPEELTSIIAYPTENKFPDGLSIHTVNETQTDIEDFRGPHTIKWEHQSLNEQSLLPIPAANIQPTTLSDGSQYYEYNSGSDSFVQITTPQGETYRFGTDPVLQKLIDDSYSLGDASSWWRSLPPEARINTLVQSINHPYHEKSQAYIIGSGSTQFQKNTSQDLSAKLRFATLNALGELNIVGDVLPLQVRGTRSNGLSTVVVLPDGTVMYTMVVNPTSLKPMSIQDLGDNPNTISTISMLVPSIGQLEQVLSNFNNNTDNPPTPPTILDASNMGASNPNLPNPSNYWGTIDPIHAQQDPNQIYQQIAQTVGGYVSTQDNELVIVIPHDGMMTPCTAYYDKSGRFILIPPDSSDYDRPPATLRKILRNINPPTFKLPFTYNLWRSDGSTTSLTALGEYLGGLEPTEISNMLDTNKNPFGVINNGAQNYLVGYSNSNDPHLYGHDQINNTDHVFAMPIPPHLVNLYKQASQNQETSQEVLGLLNEIFTQTPESLLDVNPEIPYYELPESLQGQVVYSRQQLQDAFDLSPDSSYIVLIDQNLTPTDAIPRDDFYFEFTNSTNHAKQYVSVSFENGLYILTDPLSNFNLDDIKRYDAWLRKRPLLEMLSPYPSEVVMYNSETEPIIYYQINGIVIPTQAEVYEGQMYDPAILKKLGLSPTDIRSVLEEQVEYSKLTNSQRSTVYAGDTLEKRISDSPPPIYLADNFYLNEENILYLAGQSTGLNFELIPEKDGDFYLSKNYSFILVNAGAHYYLVDAKGTFVQTTLPNGNPDLQFTQQHWTNILTALSQLTPVPNISR